MLGFRREKRNGHELRASRCLIIASRPPCSVFTLTLKVLSMKLSRDLESGKRYGLSCSLRVSSDGFHCSLGIGHVENWSSDRCILVCNNLGDRMREHVKRFS